MHIMKGALTTKLEKSTHYWEKNRRSGKGFEITQERIDVINTATEYLHTLNDLKSMQW